MKNDFISQQAARNAAGPKPAKRLYSIAGLMRGKDFTGKFETSSANYAFTFAPTVANLKNGKLELTGNLSVHASRGAKREVKGVQATLLSIQSGISNVPEPIKARVKANPVKTALPMTEATDDSGYVGVLYFRLSPINSRALGLLIDLSQVQLNARLFPDSDAERELQFIYADVVAAAYRNNPDTKEAAKNVAALNQIFSRG